MKKYFKLTPSPSSRRVTTLFTILSAIGLNLRACRLVLQNRLYLILRARSFKFVTPLLEPVCRQGRRERPGESLTHLKKLLSLTALFFIASFCQAQTSTTENYVSRLFEKPEQLQWIKHYKGRIDDLTDIALTMGFDGENCKGQLTYLRSAEKIEVEGKIANEEFMFQEVNKAKEVSGIWEGRISGKFILGTWTNARSLKGGKILLEEVEKEATFPSYCGDNKWVRKYSGKIFGEKVEMVLQREGNHQIAGIAFFERKNKTFTAKGEILENDIVTIALKNQKGIFSGTFDGFLENDFLKLKYKNQEKNIEAVTFSPDEGLMIGCMEYADYMTTYDITYPKTTNAAFNKWMEKEAKAWVSACRNRLEKNKRQVKTNMPNVRAKDRGFAWCTVDFFSKGLISGYMTYTNSWTPGQKVVPFNFDFEKSTKIDLEDIFDNDKDYEKYIRNYIKKEIKNNRLNSDPDFKKWIKKNDFSLFTIRKDGICFSTKFHMLYGQQSVTIPYRQLKPFFKKNHPIGKVFK